MRVLLVGDPHLKVSSMETSKKFLRWLLKLQNQLKPQYVVMLGDQFDTHSIMRVEVLNLWVDYLRESSVGHILLKGNHDETAPGSNLHALVALEKWAKIIDEPTEFDGMAFIPYVHTEREFVQAVQSILLDEPRVLFCHQSFQGACYENGYYDPNGFSIDSLKEYSDVVSGHIHKAQKVANVWYPGTPFASSFSDADETKGVWMAELKEGKITSTKFYESPCAAYHVKTAESPSEVLKYFSGDLSPEDHFKVILRDSRASVRVFVESPDFKELKKKFKLTFSPEYTDTVRRDVKLNENKDVEDIMSSYIDNVLETSLNKVQIHEMAKEVLAAVVAE